METQLSDNALKGKIARLPGKLREEICKRLHDGQSARKLLPWLNALPEVQAILEAEFAGVPVSDQNLTVWRQTGFVDWQRRAERIERTRELAAYAAQVSRANGSSIAEGAQAIASGKILELLEVVDEATEEGLENAATETGEASGRQKLTVESLVALAGALSNLRTSEQNDVRLQQNVKRLAQKDEEIALAREKFQRETVEIAIKILADDRAKSIEAGTGTNAEKIEAMGQHIFGELWKAKPSPQPEVKK